jgi:pimeloyl-ACP methyl ester carboxylesterase
MPYSARDGVSFHYSDLGEGFPIVFQHGLGVHLGYVVAMLQPPPGFRLLTMDFRGHGDTRPLGPIEKIGMAAFADDLLALMDSRGIGQAVLGGSSMGAAVALNLALRFPHRVCGLILARPCWIDRPLPPNARVFVSIARFLHQYGAIEGRERFGQSEEYRELSRQWPYVSRSLLDLFNDPRAEETAVKFERIANDAPCHDLSELAAIRVPTLVLANRDDPVHPFEYGELLANAIPHAQVCELTPKSESEERHAADMRRSIAEFLKSTFGDPPCCH